MDFLGLGLGMGLIVALVIVIIFVFEVWMFIDAIKNPRLTDTERLLWCLGMLFIHPIVAIVYYFLEYSKPR